MAAIEKFRSRICFLLMLLSLAVFATAPAAEELPDYVIEQFGAPPPIPDGPISEELDTALRVAFVDFFETGVWDSDQREALDVIVQAKDPRAAWVITDMMRFSFNSSFDRDLAVATSDLL
ncbi:MAG: hypothetical protein AAF576_10590, partial [Pseudomonadota bacterium]